MLRQRKNPEHSENKLQRSPSQLFSPSYELQIPKIASQVPEFMRDNFTTLLEKSISDHSITDVEKIKSAQALAKVAVSAQHMLKHFADNPEELENQIEESKRLNAAMREAEARGEKPGTVEVQLDDDSPSFILQLLESLGLAVISNALPLSTLALPVAAGMATQLNSGVPQGMTGLCQGAFNCIEGYLSPLGEPTQVLSQIARSVDVSTGGEHSGPDWAYINCLGLDKFEPMLKSFYANATEAGTMFCQQPATMYNSNTANVIATQLPVNNCNAFAQNVTVIYNQCKGYSFNVGWIVFGAIAGAIAVGALVTLAVCCCRDRCRNTCC